jgi:hypothetical protein
MVQRSLKPRQLRQLLAGNSRAVFLLRSQFRFKRLARSLVGQAAYQKLWMSLSGTEDVTTPKVVE